MKRSALPLLLALGATLTFTECATIGPPQPPSLDLPQPPKDLRAMRKGSRVMLTWTVPSFTTDRQTIRAVGATRICRSLDNEMKECGAPVTELPPTVSAASKNAGKKALDSYTDTIPSEIQNANPSGFLTYAIEILNRADRAAGLSNQVRVLLAPTLPPPQDFQTSVTSKGVVLSWTKQVSREHQDNLHYIVRILRREEGSQQQTVVGEVPIEGESSVSDSNFDWEKTYEYHAEVVTLVERLNGSEVQIEGDDTAEVKVFAHDVFPPLEPSGVQAVFSGPGQAPFIDLVWAPVTDPDLAGYNVYRNEEGSDAIKLNSDLLKTPAYRDTHVSSGRRYFYSVTSVDVRNNESGRSEQASELVP